MKRITRKVFYNKALHKDLLANSYTQATSTCRVQLGLETPLAEALVSNLPESDWDAERIVNLYNQRMQIEEGFRDTKNERYGLALNYCRTTSIKRVEI